MANQPDTLQKKKNKFLASERRQSHWYRKTKGLNEPSKIDLQCGAPVFDSEVGFT